jgi:hypothetical protein
MIIYNNIMETTIIISCNHIWVYVNVKLSNINSFHFNVLARQPCSIKAGGIF